MNVIILVFLPVGELGENGGSITNQLILSMSEDVLELNMDVVKTESLLKLTNMVLTVHLMSHQ